MKPVPALSTSEPRGPHQICPACGSLRWVQHVALRHEHDSHWSASRSCKACGHTWEATWTEP
jgi:DNA-directed RNA polymerase subunit M/transcription elongation factor TFIIS